MNVPKLNSRSLGLYLHIPYCRKKCPYCSFASTDRPDFPEREYTDCLKLELTKSLKNEGISSKTELRSIYFGGGTPSLFTPALIGELIETASSALTTSTETEITIEVNPDSTDPEKLKELKGYGVNRLSIGIQSLDDRDLKKLGRLHDAEEAIETFKDARAAGFTNIGVDIISGIPRGDREDRAAILALSETLSKVIKLEPDHISVYGLTIEEGTPFARAVSSGDLGLYNEETERGLFMLVIDRLEAAGFNHYEISNFARPGKESSHNTRYWNGGDYIGLGASAHSFIGSENHNRDWGRRWWNVTDTDKYIRLVGSGKNPKGGTEELTREQAATEAIMLGLRQMKGIDEEAFREIFRSSPQSHILCKELFEENDKAPERKLIYSSNGRLKLTREGMLLSGEIY